LGGGEEQDDQSQHYNHGEAPVQPAPDCHL
jgi:hypothetical protein